MALYSKDDIRQVVRRAVPRTRPAPALPTDEKSVKLQMSLAEQAKRTLKELK